jgi:Glycosyltransferase family 92
MRLPAVAFLLLSAFASAVPRHSSRYAATRKRVKSHEKHVVVSVMRDESDYVVEWINYHLYLGFAHFYIYNQDDDKTLMECALKPYIDKKIVTLVPWHTVGDQHRCYKHFMSMKADIATFTFLDGDEYLVLCKHATVNDFAASVGIVGARHQNQTKCVEFAWYMFGTSGLPFHPPKTSVLTSYFHREVCPFPHHAGKIMVKWHDRGNDEHDKLPLHHFCNAHTKTNASLKASAWTASIYHYSLRGGRQSFAHRVKRGAYGEFQGQAMYNNDTLIREMEATRNKVEDTTMLTIHRLISGITINSTLPAARTTVAPVCHPREHECPAF